MTEMSMHNLEMATKKAATAVNEATTAQAKADKYIANLHELHLQVNKAGVELNRANEICNRFMSQMKVMMNRIESLRIANAIIELEAIMPEALQLKTDAEAAERKRQEALGHAEKAILTYEHARRQTDLVVAEAKRLIKIAQESIDTANMIAKSTNSL